MLQTSGQRNASEGLLYVSYNFDRIHIFSLQVFKVSAGCCRQARPENIRVIFCLIACLS